MEQNCEIKWTSKDVIDARGDLIIIEWALNSTPDPEWQQFLTSSGVPKSGSAVFIASEPRLVGDRLRITVPDSDLKAAVSWMEKSIVAANQKFEAQVLARRRREASEREAVESTNNRRLQEARDQLKRLV